MKTRIMLYVSDVEKLTNFWEQTLNAKLVATIQLPKQHFANVLSVDETTELALFSNTFVQEFSPEVADNQPSLMFFVADLDAAHARIKGATPLLTMPAPGPLAFQILMVIILH